MLEDNLNENMLRAMVKELDSAIPASTEVTLPKIKLTVNVDLAGLLKEMGKMIFTSRSSPQAFLT